MIDFKKYNSLLQKTQRLRRDILKNLESKKKTKPFQIEKLKTILKNFEKFQNQKYFLKINNQKIKFSFTYEINELKKDLIFLEKGYSGLLDYFEKKYKNFSKEFNLITKNLKNKKIDFFITDRDGTINDYCQRYNSCFQSLYNFLFVGSFTSRVKKTIILTSAPLNDFLKLILSKDKVIYAGSKGNEFLDLNGKKHLRNIPSKERKMLNLLSHRIINLLSRTKYKKFSLIGSGFQKKHGQLTISRQDIFNSIPKNQSQNFLKLIRNQVKNIDEEEEFFSINDTGLDIEIDLNLNHQKFDKGEGINYILKSLKLKPENVLVCGDTNSDLLVLKTIKKLNKKIHAIFVTKNRKLKRAVKKIYPEAKFVSNQDVLVAAFYKISNKKNGI